MCTFFVFLFLALTLNVDTRKLLLEDTIYDPDIMCQYSDMEKFSRIALNNFKCILLNYVGILTFGLSSTFSLFRGASMSGYIFGSSIVSNGFLYSIYKILPHAFELWAVISSASESMHIGFAFFSKCMNRRIIKVDFHKTLNIFILNTIIIIISAFCEVYISFKL